MTSKPPRHPAKDERKALDVDVVEWLANGRPDQPDYAYGRAYGNPEGQFTTARCLEALARLVLVNQRD